MLHCRCLVPFWYSFLCSKSGQLPFKFKCSYTFLCKVSDMSTAFSAFEHHNILQVCCDFLFAFQVTYQYVIHGEYILGKYIIPYWYGITNFYTFCTDTMYYLSCSASHCVGHQIIKSMAKTKVVFDPHCRWSAVSYMFWSTLQVISSQLHVLILTAGDQQPATCLITMRPSSGCVLLYKDVNAVDRYVQVGTETSLCTWTYL